MNSFENFLCLDSSTANHLVLRLVTPTCCYDAPQETSHLESTLIPAVDILLQKAQLELSQINAFVLGAGPGSFMGLRLGFSVFRAWAWLYDTPITCISSLNLLIQSYLPLSPSTLYITCIDAKMKRVFSNIRMDQKLLLKDCDIFPFDLVGHINKYIDEQKPSQITILGSGVLLIKELLNNSSIIFDPEVKIQNVAFEKDSLNAIPEQKFSKKSSNNLHIIEPSYLRLSAAEMTLKEKIPH